jgi:hypothetical protein
MLARSSNAGWVKKIVVVAAADGKDKRPLWGLRRKVKVNVAHDVGSVQIPVREFQFFVAGVEKGAEYLGQDGADEGKKVKRPIENGVLEHVSQRFADKALGDDKQGAGQVAVLVDRLGIEAVPPANGFRVHGLLVPTVTWEPQIRNSNSKVKGARKSNVVLR